MDMTDEEIFDLADQYGWMDDFGRWNFKDDGLIKFALAIKTAEWVGLTDEEVELYWDWEDFQTGAGRSTIFEMVRDIEAKLKEKNSG
jgi:hypothetical protein